MASGSQPYPIGEIEFSKISRMESKSSISLLQTMYVSNYGSYTCSICLDPIIPSSREYTIWHCLECYNVYHIHCVKAWAAASSQNPTILSLLALPKWKCPNCAVECQKPKATCWCGKSSIGLPYISPGRPNSCPNTCDKAGVCPHREEKICLNPCHPGPCDIPCSTTCGGLPVIPRSTNCWSRFWTRVRGRKRGSVRKILLYFTALAMIYSGLGVLLSYHIPWWSKPFKYHGFSIRGGMGEQICLGLSIVPFIFSVCSLLLLLYKGIADLFMSTLNLDSVDTKPSRKCLTKFCGGLFLALICVGIFILPFLG
jgi:hypothetical protein